MLSWLRRKFAGKVPEAYEGTTGWDYLVGWPKAGASASDSTIFQPLSASDLEEAYKLNSVVGACTRFLGRSATDPELEIGMWVGTGQEREWETVQKDIPIAEVLQQPHQNGSFATFVERYVQALALTGVSGVHKRRGPSGEIVELWPRPTSWVKMIPGKGSQMFSGFKINPSEEIILPEDMLLSMFPDPTNPARGCGPLELAVRDFQSDMERENYIGEMLRNVSVPGLKIFTERVLSDREYNRLKEKLDDSGGRGRRGQHLIVQGAGGKSQIDDSVPLKDLDWPGLSNLSEARICSAFGVSPILIGARVGLQHATYSNYEQAKRATYEVTMRPLWTFIEDEWTRAFFRDEGEPQLRFRFRYDKLPQFQEDETARTDRAVKQYTAGLIDIDEARKEIGLEPLSDEQIASREEEAARKAAMVAAIQAPSGDEDDDASSTTPDE